MDFKKCPRCKIEKVFDDFYNSKKYKSGRDTYCKACRFEFRQAEPIANKRIRQHRHYHTAKHRETRQKWQAANRDKTCAQKKVIRERKRQTVLAHYGLSCACCSESTYVFLAIDHINGGGRKHTKQIGMDIYGWLIKNGFPREFQTLCQNCNWAKHVLGKCPHQS